jgi:hypothetical protein
VDESKPIYWKWRVRLKRDAPECVWYSRTTWRKLRWRMTDDQAAAWGEEQRLRDAEGSAERRAVQQPLRLERIRQHAVAGDEERVTQGTS